MTKRCKDTAGDHRGFMIVLDDADIEALVRAARDPRERNAYVVLRERFRALLS